MGAPLDSLFDETVLVVTWFETASSFLAGAPDTWTFYADLDDPLVSMTTDSGSATAPEPATLVLFGIGMLALIAMRRRLA